MSELALVNPNTAATLATLGVLDAGGGAEAVLVPGAIGPGLLPAGLTLHHAFLAFDPAGPVAVLASNAVPLAPLS